MNDGEPEVAKLGTRKRPAVVRVRTAEKASDIVGFCQDHGWEVIAGVEPDKPEDISDLEKLMNRGQEAVSTTPRLPPKISPNDYCPCRSGKKYKKCCGAPPAQPAPGV
jgi:SWIM/SEC-C metal-binding protein